MIRRFALLTAAVACAAVLAAPAAALAATTLRLDGIGPLRLGMRTAAGLSTGWLARRGRGCELGGPPIPVTYTLSGPRAPAGVVGSAEFDSGRLRSLAFTKGVRTATGVTVGVTTAQGMVNRYKDAGFAAGAVYSGTFRGTFVTVKRGGKQVVGGFARGRPAARRPLSTLGIPYVPTCE